MGNEDRVTSVGRQSSIGLVRECQFWQDVAAFKAEVPGLETFYVYDAEAYLIRRDSAHSTFLPRGVCLRKRLTASRKTLTKL